MIRSSSLLSVAMVKALETTKEGRKRLPLPTGKFPVGCQDLLLRDSNLLVRCFYPCAVPADDRPEKWTKWFPDSNYAKGMGRFKFGRTLPMMGKALKWLTQNPLVPAVYGAEPVIRQDPFPLIVFSHGLGGFRTLYSTLLTDISSHGYFVMAVEHKDGSAAATFNVDHAGKVEWMFERKLSPEEDEYKMRNEQVSSRVKECIECLKLAERISEGSIKEDDDFVEDFKAEHPNFFKNLFGRIDTGGAIVAGHSFGGATAVKAVMTSKFKCGVLFDAWMFPIQHEADTLTDAWKELRPDRTEDDPLLFFLNCELFQGVGNLESESTFEYPISPAIPTNVITLKKAGHLAATDVPVIMLGSRAKSFYLPISSRPFGPKPETVDPEGLPLTAGGQLEACCDFFIAYLDHVLGGATGMLDQVLTKHSTHLIYGSNYKKILLNEESKNQ